ncbi:transporter substrate-binding domain-containing protein [Xenorhabdus miraniensis]|uniref:Putative ABC-type amino-acid transporter periplasmic solute-binding protein n=1 Tax=Xenorhabdus miraniensis TaxID=351674 RepID=A0A2D0JRA5_9GAMM|nr:transporter substrate-binding domain-containing protein [Xenorhabdus miraniensis]PHM48865.1 putative ABC-type amino-acid transporter periplasmic solute-binding protein [Xenorhabdus miraniensis]
MSAGAVIQRIKTHDVLNVGVSLGFIGLSFREDHNSDWEGFDIDLAKAVAIAVLGNSERINFIPLQSGDRFQALKENIIDLGCFNASITFQREIIHYVSFVHPMLFDGEILMTHMDNLINAVPEAKATKKRCIAAMRGSTTQENLERYFGELGLNCEVKLFESPKHAREAYQKGICNIYCLDSYLLSGERIQLEEKEKHILLKDRISLEAMSPTVSSYDPLWHSAVSWVMKSLVEAENLGLNKHNIHEKYNISTGYLNRFLKPSKELCNKLGLQAEFTYKIISEIGNYGEIFERNLGKNSILNQERRKNKPWAEGGMLYSPLFI